MGVVFVRFHSAARDPPPPTPTGGALAFPRSVKELLLQGFEFRNRFRVDEVSSHGLKVMAGRLTMQMSDLVSRPKVHEANARFAKFLEKHLDDLFTFLRYPGTDATNWRGEQATEFVQLDIGNGVSMDAWMIKPKDFDPSKKYPVFVYVYGEPHAQTVLNEWGVAQIDFHRVVADLGYLVVSIDNRGTPAPKGAAWRRSIFGSLGPLSTEEQEAGLKELGRMRPYVDLSRVGIWGWSGGGSNTLNAMFRKPNSYHVGIAVVPKPQPHLYKAWFQEIFMRTREVI